MSGKLSDTLEKKKIDENEVEKQQSSSQIQSVVKITIPPSSKPGLPPTDQSQQKKMNEEESVQDLKTQSDLAEPVTIEQLQEQLKKTQEELKKTQEREKELKTHEEEVAEREEKAKAKESEIEKKERELKVKEENLDSKAESLKAQTKINLARQERMDKLYGDLDETTLSELKKEMEDKDKDQEKNQKYSSKQRKKMLKHFNDALDEAKRAMKEIQERSNKVGKGGLKRKDEMMYRSRIIQLKSRAKKEYITMTGGSDEEVERAMMNEEIRMLVRLRAMYMAFGEMKKVGEMTSAIAALRGAQIQVDIDEVEEAMKNPPQVDEEEEIEEKKEIKSEKTEEALYQGGDLTKEEWEMIKKLDEEDKKKEMTDDIRRARVEEEIEKTKKQDWVKGFKPEEQLLIAVYGNVRIFRQRKVWLDKYKEEHPDFKEPETKEIEDILNAILAKWAEKHKIEELAQPQQDVFNVRHRIPEMNSQKDPESESMRMCVNGLYESRYISVKHTEREVQQEEFDFSVKRSGEVKEDGPLKGYEYEHQDRENDCWSVALAALVNFNVTEEDQKINQGKVREFTPEFRKKAKTEKDEDYGKAKEEIETFTTRNQTQSYMGNIFALSDHISQHVKNAAIRHMTVAVPKCRLDDERNKEKHAVHNVTDELKKTIRGVVESGQPIAVLKGSHYRVIVKADQNGVTLLNSGGDKAHLDENVPYSDLLAGNDVIELTWLQTKNLGDLTGEFKGLKKDGKTFSSETDENLVDPDLVAVTKGVVVHKKDKDIPEDVREYISERVYVPKEMSEEEEKPKEEQIITQTKDETLQEDEQTKKN